MVQTTFKYTTRNHVLVTLGTTPFPHHHNASHLPSQFSSVECSQSKSCLRDPVGCDPESDPRCFFLSFTADEAGGSVMFEVSGPAEGYMSIALSLDKWMVSFIMKCTFSISAVTTENLIHYVLSKRQNTCNTQESLLALIKRVMYDASY